MKAGAAITTACRAQKWRDLAALKAEAGWHRMFAAFMSQRSK